MKKFKTTAISIVLLAMFSVTLLLPIVTAFHGHITINHDDPYTGIWYASRCDHLIAVPDLPSVQDAWTACGLTTDHLDADHWSYASFFFRRSFGGAVMWPYTWVTDGSMTCTVYVDSWSQNYIRGASPVWKTADSTHPWSGYYHDETGISINPIQPAHNGETVGAMASSWFIRVGPPYDRVYIQSFINPNDLDASDPNEQDVEF